MSLWTKIRNSFTKPLKKLLDWLLPEMDDNRGIIIEKQGTNNSYDVVYGTSVVGAVKIFKLPHNEPGGAKNEYLNLVCVFCEGEVDEIEEIFFNDIPSAQIDSERYYIEKFNGSDNQSYCSTLGNKVGAWKNTATLNGLCYAYIRLKINKKLDWWQGEPQIKARIRGRKVKDIRTNTWGYSENPALMLWDYLTNTRFGKGSDESELDLQSFKDAADYCEQGETFDQTEQRFSYDPELREYIRLPPTTTQVTKPRMTCNVTLKTDRKVIDNVKELRSGCRGMLIPSENGIKLLIEQGALPVYHFDNDNLRDEKVDSKGGDKNSYHNRVTVRYPSQQLNGQYDEVSWPEKDSDIHNEWLIKDNNIPLERSYDFPTIDNAAEALQMAEVVCRRSRATRQIKIPGKPWTIVVEVGDVVTIDEATHGYDAKAFRIIDKTILIDGNVDFEAIVHQDSIYPWSVNEVNEYYPETSFSHPQNIAAPSGLALDPTPDDNQYYGVLSWDDPNDVMVSSHDVTIYRTDNEGVVYSKNTQEHSVLVPLFNVGEYRIEVRALNSLFASSAAVLLFTSQTPLVPNSLGLTASTFEIQAVPSVAQDNHFVEFELLVNTDNNRLAATKVGRGRSFAIIGREADTTYYLWAKTVTPYGESAWAQGSIKTLDGQAIADLITELPSVDLTELENSIDDLNEDIDEVIESIIWNTVQHQETTTDKTKSNAEIKDAKETIATETEARTLQAAQINASIETEKGRIDASLTRLEVVEADVEGNASAIFSVNGTASSAYSTANSAFSIAQQAKTTADGNAVSITQIQNVVNNPTTGMSATASLALLAKTTADDNVSAVATLQATINDAVENGTATDAELQLAVSGNTNNIDTLKAEAFLFTDVNGRIAGMKATSTAALSSLDFIGDKITFLKTTGDKAFYFDNTTGEWVFNGNGTFNGTIFAQNIEGDVVDAATIKQKELIFSGTNDASYHEIYRVTIATQPFARTVHVSPPRIEWGDIPSVLVQVFRNGALLTTLNAFQINRYSELPALVDDIPADTAYQYSYRVSANGYTGSAIVRGDVLVSVFKKGSSITVHNIGQ